MNNFQLSIEGKVWKFLSLYRSPSQNRDELETFLDNLGFYFDDMTETKSIFDSCS